MLLWVVALLGWGLAAAGGWAAWHWLREVERQRRLRSVADYAAHKAAEREAAAVARGDALLLRLGRTQARSDDVAEAAAAVAMLGQLDALYEPASADGIPRESRDGC